MGAPTFATTGRYVHATFDGDLYFGANDGVHGYELWRTDGTATGTRMVTDDFPAREDDMDLYIVSDRLFVVTGSGRAYAYDGTQPPVRITGFGTMPTGVNRGVTGVVADRLILTGSGYDLYAVDPGTTVARLVDSPGRKAFEFAGTDLAVLGDWAYFSGRDRTSANPTDPTDKVGVELLRTNGTVTELVKDINPGPDGSYPQAWITAGDTLFFQANDGVHEEELWTTDGTDAGTHLVRDHRTDGSSGFAYSPLAHGDEIYYLPGDGGQLWRSDGTDEGTHLVADVSAADGASLLLLASVGSEVYYLRSYSDRSVRPAVQRGLLVRTDGTPEGTRTVAQLPGSIFEVGRPAVVGDRLYFSAPSAYGSALWRSDGTANGTFPVSLGGFDGTGTAGDPDIHEARTLGNRVVFSSRFRPEPGSEPTTQRRLYVVDPTIAVPPRRATAAPELSWDDVTGKLAVSTGTWTPGTDTFTYQWFRDGAAIPEATGPTLQVRSMYEPRLGDRIAAVVTGAGVGSASATASSPTVRVTRAALAPLPPIARPRVQGRPVVGRHLVAAPEERYPDSRTSYRWFVGKHVVPRIHGPRLRLVRAYIGKKVQVQIIMSRTGNDTRRSRSLPTAAVRGARHLRPDATPTSATGATSGHDQADGRSSSTA
ncbi:hypothetical protein [Nocardioides sp.]|uniref:hypothetical protein n=1 Tax=Nocardioides sp. TaxID=35761 RepID=UPI00271D19A0|nr:hypothetical protein [Nocardioides sp.]MDO9454507.1 hypothetical protein [Nocardioides sp.]